MMTKILTVVAVWQAVSIIMLIRGFLKAKGEHPCFNMDSIREAASLMTGTADAWNYTRVTVPHVNASDLFMVRNPWLTLIFNKCGSIAFVSGSIIVCEDTFYKLPYTTQRVILMHEVGHALDICDRGIKTVKKENRGRLLMAVTGRVSETERIADAHAVRTIGREATIDALKEIKSCVNFIARKEIDVRINLISQIPYCETGEYLNN